MSEPPAKSGDHAPLRPVEFQILLSLAEGERHGYAIILETEARTGGEMRMEPGTLYRALHRMKGNGLIQEQDRRPTADLGSDPRRRYYSITTSGRAAAAEQAGRLSRLVDAARAARLLPAG